MVATLESGRRPDRFREGSDARAYAGLTLAALFWAGNFVAGRAIRGDIDPLSLNVLRWTLCLILFVPFVIRPLFLHRAAVRREWRLLLAIGATGIAGFHTLVYAALRETTVINALLILSLAPATTFICAAAIGDSRPSGRQWIGSAVALIGAAVLVTRGSLEKAASLELNSGDILMICAVGVWTIYTLLLRRRPADLPQNVTLASGIVAGLVLMAPAWAWFAPASLESLSLDIGTWTAIGYIALCASLVAFLLWMHGVSAIGAARAGQFVHLLPVFGAVLAMALLGETVSAAQSAGAAFVVAGIVLVNSTPR